MLVDSMPFVCLCACVCGGGNVGASRQHWGPSHACKILEIAKVGPSCFLSYFISSQGFARGPGNGFLYVLLFSLLLFVFRASREALGTVFAPGRVRSVSCSQAFAARVGSLAAEVDEATKDLVEIAAAAGKVIEHLPA